ncbi:MAG: response regulator [Acidimicrobiales bacterium]
MASVATRVLIVDDHAIVRRGLRSILELERDIEVVAEAGTAAEAMKAAEHSRPEIVLLDLRLGPDDDREGLVLCSRIVERLPATRVVVLSTFLEERLVLEALRRGAQAYVLKDVDAVELVRIIRAVSRGESGFDSRSAAVVARSIAGDRAESTAPRLTDREREVVKLITEGLSNREIGTAVFLSESTVKFHVRNVMRKLDVSHRAEVAYVASRLGLLEER